MNNNIFAAQLLPYTKHYDLEPLFEDFLDLCLCVLSPGALAGVSWDRERFGSIMDKYADPACPLQFTPLFAALLGEMKDYEPPHECFNDVLGDFYETHMLRYDPDMPFRSWDLDTGRLRPEVLSIPGDGPGRKNKLLDGRCGSGRRLLAKRWMHTVEVWYGMEITPVCAKMATLNLFLHQVPEAEIICVKADDAAKQFLFGYAFSRNLTGIQEIKQGEQSRAWQMQQGARAMAA